MFRFLSGSCKNLTMYTINNKIPSGLVRPAKKAKIEERNSTDFSNKNMEDIKRAKYSASGYGVRK